MSTVDLILNKLERIHPSGHNHWTARCPAHKDKNPSLSVSDAGDGRILLHCFAGCSPEAILTSLGLTFADVMPERLPDHKYGPIRRPFPAADVLECLQTEALIVQLCAYDMAHGKELPEFVQKRLEIAYDRIREGRGLANGIG